MRKLKTVIAGSLLALGAGVSLFIHGAASGDQKQAISVVRNDAARRVDVLADGKPFTSYTYPANLYKPILFPLRSATGTVVTRGYPLEPRPGESKDHPHHTGAWFNYGDVNGIDFWGHSDASKPSEKLGSIVHRTIKEARSGKDKGELEVTADWVMSDGSTILKEETEFIFRAGPNARIIDRITKLTALDKPVVFNDTKEGALGIRVAKSLEQPSKSEGREGGKATGLYLSSEGKTGDDVWGTRGRWVILTGTVEDQPVTLAIFDHPKNPGFPTYWHARGYGLFAANPFGWKEFSKGKEEFKFTIEPKRSATFRWRILILSDKASDEQAEAQFKRFVEEVK